MIIPSLGENVPDYYQLIDQTPGGQSADLNSGSFRAAEVFVCYRRSRDRAPLLDIGVLYDGKYIFFQILEKSFIKKYVLENLFYR